MKQTKVRVYKDWVEMLNPLLISNPDGWETIVALALGIAFGAYDPDVVLKPELMEVWLRTEIIPAANGREGIIQIKKAKHGSQVS